MLKIFKSQQKRHQRISSKGKPFFAGKGVGPVIIPEGKSGDWEVAHFTVSKQEADMFNLRAAISFSGMGRGIKPGKYMKLVRGGHTVVMSNTPAEIRDQQYFEHAATGNILINGLGLGVAVSNLLKKSEVAHVTVIENSPDVIKLVAEHLYKVFGKDRLEIIQANAFEWQPPKGVVYDYVWHDIWDNICGDNYEEMKKLRKKYARKAKWQQSWCEAETKRLRG